MRQRKPISLLAYLLLLPALLLNAAAETGEANSASDAQPAANISAARAAYMQNEGTRAQESGDGDVGDREFARFTQHGHPGRFVPRGRYPRYDYGAFHQNVGRHILIGALIGLGLGVAVGLKEGEHQNPGSRAKITFGFGVFGAAIGAGIGATAN